jgi:hypothetical protein
MAQPMPVHKFRLGAIVTAIWENQSQTGGHWYNVTVLRRYKNGNEWKDSVSFNRDDLPVVAKALDMAYAWIWEQEAISPKPQEQEPEPELEETELSAPARPARSNARTRR